MAPRSTVRWCPHTRRLAAGALVGFATLALARPCRADDQQAFELAKNPFDAGQFAVAHDRLSTLLDTALPPCETASAAVRCHIADTDLIERTRALDAASLIALKREAEADVQIGKILRANPQYAPNPALFPQEVIDRFTTVRGKLRPELEAIAQQKAREELAKRVAAQKAREAEEKWIAELEKQAGEEKRVQPNTRWMAMVPFGVGQFQNGDTRLGVVFAVSEALLGTASLAMIVVVNKLASTDTGDDTAGTIRSQLNNQILTATRVNQVTFAGWAALMIAGVVQAQVAFVPERTTTQKRPIPPRPKLAPVALPVQGGGILGLAGTF